MTRKDYTVLAAALMEATPLPSDGLAALRAWQDCVRIVSKHLEADNPRFDRVRFLNAAAGTFAVNLNPTPAQMADVKARLLRRRKKP